MAKQKKWGVMLLALGITAVTLAAAGGMSWLLYQRTVALLTNDLQKRLVAISRTAVAEIDAQDVEALQTEADYKKPEWARVVSEMKSMRESNDDIIYMYIFRKSKSDPNKMIFVADSHSLNPYVNEDGDPTNDVDLNGDGKIDDADLLQWPGQPYPEPPPETFNAYNGPTANMELYADQWGAYLSGYAPIKDKDGNVVGILAADVRADDFFVLTTQTLIPFLIFIFGLTIVILTLSVSLIVIWRRQTNLVLQLDRQKDELINLVSHQLKSPVSSIRWNLNDFLDGEFGMLTEVQKEQMRNDLKTTDNLLELVALLLDASRIELGKLQVDKKEQNLTDFFAEINTVIEGLAKEKGVQFIRSFPQALPTGTFDKRLTHMTIENLLTNAVKYTPAKGTVELKVEMHDKVLRCVVRDTGMGIPKEDQAQLFTKMFRARNVKSVEGTGLGLYVAKGAVEQQGGKLWFESEENKGTTFFMELPI